MCAQVFGAALNACANADASADVAMSVLERAKNSGLEPNAVSLSSLVHLMSKNGRIKEAEDFIDQMADSDIPATVEVGLRNYIYIIYIYTLYLYK